MLEQLKNVLKSLKWTESQASVYCTLVEKGAMKPADLVIHAGVAQGKIYSVLDDLKSKGVIIKLKSSTAKYDAQNPRHVLEKILSDVEKMKDLALSDAEQAYEKRYEQSIGKINCWSIEGISGILIQLRVLFGECEKSLKICDFDLNWLGNYEHKLLNKMMREKKKIEILSTNAFKDVLEDLKYKGANVKMKDSLSSYYIIDNETVLMRFSSPDSGMVVKDPTFIAKTIKEFDNDFKSGSEVRVSRIET